MKITKQLKAQGVTPKKKLPKRLPKQQLPVALERTYAKYLWTIVDAFYKEYAKVLKQLDGAMPGDEPAPRGDAYNIWIDLDDLLTNKWGWRTDATKKESTLPPGFKKQLEAAARKVARALDRKRLDRFLERHAKATDRWNAKEFSKQAKAAVGVDILTNNPKLAGQVKSFTKDNVALIKSLGEETHLRVEKIVLQSVSAGRSYKALSNHFEDAFGIDTRRATLIARDQTGKLYGQVNAERQRDAGVTRFTWRTSNDNRVREEHEALEGQVFEFSDPPSEGLPGEAIQCRCNAEPVFDMLADL